MSDTYLLIDEKTSMAQNLVLWDGNHETWTPPQGMIAAKYHGPWGVGWTWDPRTLMAIDPDPPPPSLKAAPAAPTPSAAITTV